MRRSSRMLPGLCALGALLVAAAAAAQGDAPTVGQLPGVPAPQQPNYAETAQLASVLGGQYNNARLWYFGWSGFYGVIFVSETVISFTSTGASKIAAQVNIVTSWVGLFEQLAFPPPVVVDWKSVEALPEATAEEQAQKSAAVRALFEQELKKERFYHSVWNHLIGLLVNAGVCAVMYWGEHIGGRALLNLIGGSLIWEANIFTSPNAAMSWASHAQATTGVRLQLGPVALGQGGLGVGIGGRF